MKPDFGGYVTRYNVLCSDGNTIRPDAFAHMDGKKVPMVWQHAHGDPNLVLGHAILEHRSGVGLYGRSFLNHTDTANTVRKIVKNGDVDSYSIWAKVLKRRGNDVLHGDVKEVSLVLSGANDEARIDYIDLAHSDTEEGAVDAFIFTGGEVIQHDDLTDTEEVEEDKTEADKAEEKKTEADKAEDEKTEEDKADTEEVEEEDSKEDSVEHADTKTEEKSEKSVQDVLDSFSEEQRQAMLYVFSLMVEDDDDDDSDDSKSTDKKDSNESESTEKKDSTESKSTDAKQDEVKHDNLEGDDTMSRNIFDRSDSNDQKTGPTISHSDLRDIIAEAKRTKGSLKDAFMAHADALAHSEPEQGEATPYGITNIEALFPDAQPTSATPELLKRDTTWVAKLLAGVKTTPFSRIKTIIADLTEEEARAKGYLKGTEKKEEIFPLLRRTTTPTTIYKKQKLDRDDIVDITEFDVVVWLKAEMKTMLDEELARAILLGDGREALDPDKIKDPFSDVNGEGIRSILKDNSVYTTVVEVAYDDAEALVDASVRSRRLWKGTGTPTLWTKVSVMGDMLLEKDQLGRRLYETEAQLASAMRVAEIVEVEAMEEYEDVLGVMVNPADYRVGTDRQGEAQFFDDFDIDWNQMKYLYEIRKSGALARPKSAVVFVAADVTPGGDEENPEG